MAVLLFSLPACGFRTPDQPAASPRPASGQLTVLPAQMRISLSSDVYPHNIAEDRKSFDGSRCDIIVGERLYMTQINDWFLNFPSYENKTVEIEGLYITIDRFTLIGRNGPSCPYCSGGFVDFEFHSDQDLSNLVPEESWIRIKGILRSGKTTLRSGREVPFCYIEAIDVSPAAPGQNPIIN